MLVKSYITTILSLSQQEAINRNLSLEKIQGKIPT